MVLLRDRCAASSWDKGFLPRSSRDLSKIPVGFGFDDSFKALLASSFSYAFLQGWFDIGHKALIPYATIAPVGYLYAKPLLATMSDSPYAVALVVRDLI